MLCPMVRARLRRGKSTNDICNVSEILGINTNTRMTAPMSDTHQRLPDDDYTPLSALNDLLYCERRCALQLRHDHFVDVTEMILDPMRTVETSHPSLAHDLFDVGIIGVPQHSREIPARPKLIPRRIRPPNRLKRRLMR